MFIDASALCAVLLNEDGSSIFVEALQSNHRKFVTEFVILEVGLALMRDGRMSATFAHAQIEALIDGLDVGRAPITTSVILTALQAHERYGKGRKHPARLNMGDCLSYAAARTLDLPLLYKGEDFARTDIPSALPA